MIAAGEPCEAQPEPTAFQPAGVTPRPTPDDDGGGDGSETETPTGSPGDGGTATPSASVVPVGDTELAIDAVTSGNSPTSIGEVDDCAAATEGEAFLLDVLISGVEDLLAWELPVTFDPEILRIDDHDVELFLAANEGSQVFDTSNQTPNDTGTYVASAFDAADPQTPDSGEGVLVRLVMMPVGNGVSEVGLGPLDINEDGTLDRGILLRNVDGALIGDEDGDSLFDGPAASAEIRVGSDCEDGATVVPADAQTEDDDGGSDTWIWIVSGIVIVLVAAAGTVGIAVMRRRSSGPPTPPMTPTG